MNEIKKYNDEYYKNVILNNIDKLEKRGKELNDYSFSFENGIEINFSNVFWDILRNKEKNYSFVKSLNDYLFYINNKVVNAVEYFANKYLLNEIKKNDEKIKKLKKNDSKNNKQRIENIALRNRSMKDLKKEFQSFLSFSKISNDEKNEKEKWTFKEDYLSQYFYVESNKYDSSFHWFWNEILLKNVLWKEIFVSYLSNFLFIESYYLKDNFINDLFIFNKLRNAIKLEAYQDNSKGKTKRDEDHKKSLSEINDLEKDVTLFKFLEIAFLYLNISEAKDLERLIYSKFRKVFFVQNSTLFFTKWNEFYNHFFFNEKDNYLELNYKNFKKISEPDFDDEILKDSFQKNRILKKESLKEKESRFKDMINSLLKDNFLNKTSILFKKTNLRKSKSYDNKNNFYQEIINFFQSKTNIKILDDELLEENKRIRKTYIMKITQFININYFDIDNVHRFLNKTSIQSLKEKEWNFDSIDDFILLRKFDLDLSNLILSYFKKFDLFDKSKLREVITTLRHGSSLFNLSYAKGEISFDIDTKESLFFDFLTNEFGNFKKIEILYPTKFKTLFKLNFEEKERVDFYTKKEKFINKFFESSNKFGFLQEFLKIIDKSDLKTGKKITRLIFLDNILEKDKEETFLYSLIAFTYFYSLFNYDKAIKEKNKKSINFFKQNITNFIQDFKKIIKKYTYKKWEVKSEFLRSSKLVNKNSLFEYIDLIYKNFGDNTKKDVEDAAKKIEEKIVKLKDFSLNLIPFNKIHEELDDIRKKIDEKKLYIEDIKKLFDKKKNIYDEYIASVSINKVQLRNKNSINIPIKDDKDKERFDTFFTMFAEFKSNLNEYIKFQSESIFKKLFLKILKAEKIGNDFLIGGKSINSLNKKEKDLQIRKQKDKERNILLLDVISKMEKLGFEIVHEPITKDKNIENLLNNFKDKLKILEYLGLWFFNQRISNSNINDNKFSQTQNEDEEKLKESFL